jgi:DNA excision repair protein ERCC-4
VDIRTDSVCSKMTLLAMHFPELRIIWSCSPHETLRIFRELKTNHDEVDVEKAVRIGRDETANALLRPNGAGPVTGQKLFTFFRQKIAAT